MSRSPKHYWLVRVVLVVTALIIAATAFAIIDSIDAARNAQTIDQLRAGCERANNVRLVVFRNTANAIRENRRGDPAIKAIYRSNLNLLLSGVAVRQNGLVDCEKAFHQ